MFNKLEYYLDKYKYGLMAVVAVYVGIFMYLEMGTYHERVYYEPFFEEPALIVPKEEEEVEINPENIEVPADFKPGDVKNISRDMNDTRESSKENWSADKRSLKDVEQSVKDYEKKLFEESGGAAERKKIQEQMEQRQKDEQAKKSTTKTTANSNQSGGSKKYDGNVMTNWSLKGRSPFQNNDYWIRNPGYTCGYGSAGSITVKIKVNQNGNVLDAQIVSSSGANECMLEQAKKYAKMSRFNYVSSAPAVQEGTITYTFISQ